MSPSFGVTRMEPHVLGMENMAQGLVRGSEHRHPQVSLRSMAEASSGGKHAHTPGQCQLGYSHALKAKNHTSGNQDLDFISVLAPPLTSSVPLAKSLLSESQFLRAPHKSGMLEQTNASFQCGAFLSLCGRRPGDLGCGGGEGSGQCAPSLFPQGLAVPPRHRHTRSGCQ